MWQYIADFRASSSLFFDNNPDYWCKPAIAHYEQNSIYHQARIQVPSFFLSFLLFFFLLVLIWTTKQGRNEVWDQGSKAWKGPRSGITALGSGITTRGIWISNIFHGMRDQGSNFCGLRDQDSRHFWNQGSKFWVKIWDQLRKNIPRYDPDKEEREREKEPGIEVSNIKLLILECSSTYQRHLESFLRTALSCILLGFPKTIQQ